jgi:Protein of unknown function (DUF2442)
MTDVTAVKPVGGYRLWLRFSDGSEGEIEMRPHLHSFRNMFAPLEDPAYFARVRVSRAAGTICWPNGLDLDPEVLHHRVTGSPLPDGCALEEDAGA